MRRKQRAADSEVAWEFLRRQRVVQLATVTPQGEPVLRVLNAVVQRGWVFFHGAIAGEKSTCIGQRAVVSAHEDVATIPSYFVDPKMACPATTYFRSVQAHGVLKNVEAPELKAAVLQHFMEFQQPEGGHEPIHQSEPSYRKELKAVRVFGVEVDRITGKESLGQDRPAKRTARVVDGLWKRGNPLDPQAIRSILDRSPEAAPTWLRGPEPLWDAGFRFVVHPTLNELSQAAALLDGRYWRTDATEREIVVSHERSSAWVGVLDPARRLIGTARALADGTARAFIYDVVVAEAYQGRGLGKQLFQLLLDHPAVRGCERILLATLDKTTFYQQFGFSPSDPDGLMGRRGGNSARPAAAPDSTNV